LKLAIVFGGAGEEHPVSVKSAREVAGHLDTAKYEPFWIGITTGGEWRLCDGPGDGWEDGRPAVLSPDRGVRGLLVLDHGKHETIGLDVVLPVLHGRLGEDGALQGLLDLSGIPYAGCDIQGSVLCMDKSLAYLVARGAGIATPEFRVVSADEDLDPGRLRYPVFVKPARSGSSFGVSRVTRPQELAGALSVDRTNLVGLLNDLEAANLIERRRSPQDRRRHTVSLTPGGTRRLAEVENALTEAEQRVLAVLDSEQQATLHALLEQVTANGVVCSEQHPTATAPERTGVQGNPERR